MIDTILYPRTYGDVGYGVVVNLSERPWLRHYESSVPADVEIPDEPITTGLRDAAKQWPQRVAIDFLGKTTTFDELATEVDRAASVLARLGVTRGTRVAIVLPNCTSHVVAFYAVLRLGGVVVEMNPTYTATELKHLLEDCGAEVAIAWSRAVATVAPAAESGGGLREILSVDMARDLPLRLRAALRLPVPAARRKRAEMRTPTPGVRDWHKALATPGAATPDGVTCDRPDMQWSPEPADADDVALLLYTGGTTGTPKAAMLTHRNLLANIRQGQAWAHFAPGQETVYGVLPFFHAFGMTLCLTLFTHIGATLVPFPKFDVQSVLATQRRRPATFLSGVAPMFDRIATAAEKPGAKIDLTSIKTAIAGAMPIPAETAARWERLTGGLLIEGYGMTETAPIILGNPCTRERRPGALGIPFPNTEIRILTDDLRDAAPGDDGTIRGELAVRGPQVFAGYWNQPEETAYQLLDGEWLRTGDVVAMDPTGFVTLVDRIKEVIIAGGFKVYPSQVEDHLRRMPGIADVAVVGVPGNGADERVAAAIVLDDSGSPDRITLATLRTWGEQRLARYALPRELVILPDLPRSQIGKVLRRMVRDQLMATRA